VRAKLPTRIMAGDSARFLTPVQLPQCSEIDVLDAVVFLFLDDI
jgi:hypothetical protein